jgi:hypothetical protein
MDGAQNGHFRARIFITCELKLSWFGSAATKTGHQYIVQLSPRPILFAASTFGGSSLSFAFYAIAKIDTADFHQCVEINSNLEKRLLDTNAQCCYAKAASA